MSVPDSLRIRLQPDVIDAIDRDGRWPTANRQPEVHTEFTAGSEQEEDFTQRA